MNIRKVLLIGLCISLLSGCSLHPLYEKKEASYVTNACKKESSAEASDSGEDESKLENQQGDLVMAAKEQMEEAEKIDNYLSTMSMEEKIGQLFIIAARKDKNGNPVTEMNEEVKKQIQDYHIGGIILFSENIAEKEQVQKLIHDMQDIASIPLYIGVDEEGGTVSRVGANSHINKIPFKEAYSIGETNDVQVALEESERMGQLLRELGFNLDFAPIADIYNEPANKIIGRRSFGNSKEIVTPMVLAFCKGLQQEGIQPVVKHFPGHGNTVQDSHEGIAYISKSLSELEKEELVPFEEAIKVGAGAVMKGHLLAEAVDGEHIVSLSDKWKDYMESHYNLSDILIMTDAMDMGAVVQNYGVGESAVLGIKAGNDILLMPYNLEEAYEAVWKAYENGQITEQRINQSVRKILSKKVAQKLLVLA